jgi:hypothetical protein
VPGNFVRKLKTQRDAWLQNGEASPQIATRSDLFFGTIAPIMRYRSVARSSLASAGARVILGKPEQGEVYR